MSPSSRSPIDHVDRATLCRYACVFFIVTVSSVATAQTSGLIASKPACIPAYGQVIGGPDPCTAFADAYIEGPEPLLLDDGSIAIYVDVGAGAFNAPCHGRDSGEALEVLHFPASGALPPRWYPVYATNNWGTDSDLKEAEGAFPVVRYFNGLWRLFYIATLDYCSRLSHCGDPGGFCELPSPTPCSTDYDRTGRIDMASPTGQPVSRNQWWIQPLNAACGNTGVPPADTWGGTTLGVACPNDGSGWPYAVIDDAGQLFVYHHDGNAGATCDSRFIRHKVQSTMALVFEGNCSHGQPANIFDIARGTDNYYYMLGHATSPYPAAADGIREWRSPDGLNWVLNSGRQPYTASCTAFGLNADCWLSGAAYLKDKTGRIVSPRLVVGTIGNRNPDGSPLPPNGMNWRLFYWAEQNAPLPASWSTAPRSCPAPSIVSGGQPSYGGNFDWVSSEYVFGWAWDWYAPNSPVNVDIYADGVKFTTVAADSLRPDLATPTDPYYYYGGGYHGFVVTVPRSLLDGNVHSIGVKYAGTPTNLPNSPRSLGPLLPNYQGNHDSSGCYVTNGWAWDSQQPNTPIPVDIYVDGQLRDSVSANLFRGDLLAAGIGNGYHGFTWTLPTWLRDGAAHAITTKFGGTTVPLWNTPRSVACPAIQFHTVTPCRRVDTREAGSRPALAGGSTRQFQVAGSCGVPTSAKAVAANLTVVAPSATGDLKVYPSDLNYAPSASSLSFSAGITRANNGILGLGANGAVVVYNTSSGATHFLLDVVGYFE